MKEADIRPASLIARYIELSAADADIYFRAAPRTDIPCVACGRNETSAAFSKVGFSYVTCDACGSLYQSPRPEADAFTRLYRDSESSRYWANTFFPAVAESRRERIMRPRAERLARIIAARGVQISGLVDVGAGAGIFLQEIGRLLGPDVQLVAIEPSEALAEDCRQKGLSVIECTAEQAPGEIASVVTCWEVFEHVHSPLHFARHLRRLGKPGGLVCVSTLCIDGFDLQMLWEKSQAISPPHHINFLSVRGLEILFQRAGLHDVEVITPGVLDVDIVRNAKVDLGRWINKIISDEALASDLQQWLIEHRLSSHAWIIGRIPVTPL